MSRASTEMEAMRVNMKAALEKLSEEELRAMLRSALDLATTYDMNVMASTVFDSYEDMVFELDLN